MNLDTLLVTLDAVLDALPDDIDKEHPERLKRVRELVEILIMARKVL